MNRLTDAIFDRVSRFVSVVFLNETTKPSLKKIIMFVYKKQSAKKRASSECKKKKKTCSTIMGSL